MSKIVRKFLIAGNWKMNLNSSEGAELARDIVSMIGRQTDVSVCLCPPATSLQAIAEVVNDSTIFVGAQNMHSESSGAYTGEISAEMLRHLFCKFVILGHSERREYFGETDEIVNKKALAALSASLSPIICVGETLDQREKGKEKEVIKEQLEGALQGVAAESCESMVIAYEPVWAIGTGKTATPDMAEEMHAEIRCLLAGIMDEKAAEKVRILYGGSMKPENAEALLAQTNIDGGLIGGASLKAASFSAIVESALKLSR